MARILIACSTVDGHTRRICERIQRHLAADGHAVTLRAMEDLAGAALDEHDKVVVGASIRYGKHRPNVLAFANAHAARLDTMPSAFFSVNIVARKPQKNRPETNPYVIKLLRQVRWKPGLLDVFAGKLDYPRYRFFDRLMIRFIMLVTKGPTDPTAVVEFTDWERVDAFAARVSAL
jgi:menaquinone-dependent protoporphyrinogen oxidase